MNILIAGVLFLGVLSVQAADSKDSKKDSAVKSAVGEKATPCEMKYDGSGDEQMLTAEEKDEKKKAEGTEQ